MFIDKPFTFDRTVRLIITILIFLAAIWLIGYLSAALIPFASALVITYLLNPIVNFMTKKIRSRVASVIIVVFGGLGLIVTGIWFLIPLIINEVNNASVLLTQLYNSSQFTFDISGLPDKISTIIQNYINNSEIQKYLNSENMVKLAEDAIDKLLPGVFGLISGTASLLSVLFTISVIILYLFFLMLDYDEIIDEWKDLLPVKYKAPVLGFISDFESIMNRYFRGQALVAMIEAGLFAIGLSIIGLPLGIIIGIFTGILVMVPYLHVLGLIPCFFSALAYSFETGNNFWGIFGMVIAVFLVVQIIQDYFLIPRIMGKVTGFNPAMILLSISIWGELLGILGLIIALPMTYLILTYYKRFLAQHAQLHSSDAEQETETAASQPDDDIIK